MHREWNFQLGVTPFVDAAAVLVDGDRWPVGDAATLIDGHTRCSPASTRDSAFAPYVIR